MVQLVGGSLSDHGAGERINHVSERPARWFAERYRADDLEGGHVIQLGPGNEEAAREALAAWPGHLQLGGGVSIDNAPGWLDAGAAAVIVTSWVFREGQIDTNRLRALSRTVGARRLVLDLSCRKREGRYIVTTDRWQRFTDVALDESLFRALSPWCGEFLVHAVDVEGLCRGIDEELISRLADWSPLPVTYAGGANSMRDLDRVHSLSGGRVDLTIGSALDIFGGATVAYKDCVAFNRAHRGVPAGPLSQV